MVIIVGGRVSLCVSCQKTPCCTLTTLTCVQFFPNFLRMHGKTYDFKMPYDSISRIFMLPKPDQQVRVFRRSVLYWTLS